MRRRLKDFDWDTTWHRRFALMPRIVADPSNKKGSFLIWLEDYETRRIPPDPHNWAGSSHWEYRAVRKVEPNV
jgi:hypothetical protein